MTNEVSFQSTQFIVQLTVRELENLVRNAVSEVLKQRLVVEPDLPDPDEKLLTIDELCKKLQVSRDLIYRLRMQGKLPEYRVGKRKFFKFSEVLQSIKSNPRRSNG